MKRRMLLVCVALLLPLLMAQSAFGADKTMTVSEGLSDTVSAVATPAVQEAAVATSLTFGQIMSRGGWLMYVIAGLSCLAIALVIFYCFTMRASVLIPQKFILMARACAEKDNYEGLADLCSEDASPAAKIVGYALEQIVPGQAVNYDRLRGAMEDEGARQASILWQRLQYLMDVAVISPMVGLLGTVWGMMLSFGGIETGADFAKKAETMASGVAQAMYTTFGGLIVGIFAMALYDLVRGHLNKLIGELESACGSVLKNLAPVEPGKGTGFASNQD